MDNSNNSGIRAIITVYASILSAVFCDLFAIVMAGLVVFFSRNGQMEMDGRYVMSMVLVSLFMVLLQAFSKQYHFSTLGHFFNQAKWALISWTVTFALVINLAFLGKVSDHYSRIWVGEWFLGGLVALWVGRMLVYLIYWRLHSSTLLRQRAIIIGPPERVQKMIAVFDAEREKSVCLVAIFLEDNGQGPDLQTNVPIYREIDQVMAFCQQEGIDRVFLTHSHDDEEAIEHWLGKLRHLPVHIDLAPGLAYYTRPNRSMVHVAGLSMLSLVKKPMSGGAILIKRLEDIVLFLVGILTIFPLMLLIAVVIHFESPGPVVFRQKRGGFNGVSFFVYKFRTMYDAPADSSPNLLQATRHDARVTRVGHWLRRLSLDELPQLFNVLKGEMSLVGPRPHAIQHDCQYAREIDSYLIRHKIKPGITGWAQINGYRGQTEPSGMGMRRRVEHDIYYIDHWSLFLDLKILFLTVFKVFNANAY